MKWQWFVVIIIVIGLAFYFYHRNRTENIDDLKDQLTDAKAERALALKRLQDFLLADEDNNG